MKKVLLSTVIVFMSLSLSAQAEVLKGKAVEDISTSSPKEFISIKLSRDFYLDSETPLKKDYILTGKMLDITDPDKWHHNASFTFIPTSYTDLDGVNHPVTKEIKATYKQKIKPDYKHSEFGVCGITFSPSYIDNTKKILNGETREVWDDYVNRTTPWGKGTQIDIKQDETIYFNFPD